MEIPDIPLPDFVFGQADRWPGKAAFIDGPSGRSVSYAELQGEIRRVAASLHRRGFGRGATLGIYSPNRPEFGAAFFGAIAAGGAVTTASPLFTAVELGRQLADAGARYLVTADSLLGKAREAARVAGVKEVFTFGKAAGATPFADLLQGDGDAPAPKTCVRDDVIVLPYSSGTTGLPKGVMLTHRNLVANVLQTLAADALSERDVVIGLLPFYHIYGMLVVLCMALRVGATVVTMPRFDLAAFLRLMQSYGVTKCHLAPPVILALANDPIVDRYDLSSVQKIVSGAAPLPIPVAVGCAKRLGCVVQQGYGLTEASPVTHWAPPGRKVKPDSVGFPVPNTEVRIVDIDTEKDLPANARGEIWIRGPQVMKGYHGRPDATRAMITPDGWLRTGDIGYVDENGYHHVVDRLKELIKYKGRQVAPAELEAVLQAHPAVADAAVVPSPDEESGQVPKAFVVLKEEAEADDIMAFVAARVAPYKKVRMVEFVDSIPKVASGKILRRELVLRERAAAADSRTH